MPEITSSPARTGAPIVALPGAEPRPRASAWRRRLGWSLSVGLVVLLGALLLGLWVASDRNAPPENDPVFSPAARP